MTGGSINPASLRVLSTTLSISLRVLSSITRFDLSLQKLDKFVKDLLFLFREANGDIDASILIMYTLKVYRKGNGSVEIFLPSWCFLRDRAASHL
jgi:hypothetical protein